MKSERSPEPFAILAVPRSGTHYLEELLNEHPNVVSNGELLNEHDPNWPDKARLLRSDRELLECAYLRHPTRSDKTDVTHVGCKINEPHFYDRPGIMAELGALAAPRRRRVSYKSAGIAPLTRAGEANR